MIQSVEFVNAQNESLLVTLTRPDLSGIGVQNIEGLGSPQMDLSTTGIYSMDGSVLGNVRAQNRNIVFTLYPMAYPDVETSRQLLYRYLPLKSKVRVVFATGNRVVAAEGYVESNEPDIFSFPETVQISVVCTDPYFYDSFSREISFSEPLPMFEFPFSNESLTEPLLEFSELQEYNELTIDYTGEVETGFVLWIRWEGGNKPLGNIEIYNLQTGEKISINSAIYQTTVGTNQSMVVTPNFLGKEGIDIRIDSRDGKKTAIAQWNSVDRWNITPALGRDIQWLTLRPGRQTFAYFSEQNSDQLRLSIDYANRYMGV